MRLLSVFLFAIFGILAASSLISFRRDVSLRSINEPAKRDSISTILEKRKGGGGGGKSGGSFKHILYMMRSRQAADISIIQAIY